MKHTIFILFALTCFNGCENRMLWNYRDDPYLHEYSQKDENFLVMKTRSMYTDDRKLALRVLANLSRKYRQAGNTTGADRVETIIFEQFEKERNPEIRSCILAVCVPILGNGNSRSAAFLRHQIASGTISGKAALSLASIEGRKSFDSIEPLTRHPDPNLRYAAALALTVCGDSRGSGPVFSIAREIAKDKPDLSQSGITPEQASTNLTNRASFVWGNSPTTN